MSKKSEAIPGSRLTVWSTFRRLFRHAGAYRLGILLAIALLAAKMVLDIGFATVQQLFIDTMTNGDVDGLRRITVLCGIVCAIVLVCLIFQHYFRFVADFRMTWDLRFRLFDKSNRMPFQHIQSMHSGDLASRNNKDATSAMSLVSSVVYELLYNLLLTLISFIYLARMDVWIALLALGSGPIVFFSSRLFDRKLRRLSVEISKREAELRAMLQETVQGITIVKAFGAESAKHAKYVEERAKLELMQKRRIVWIGLLWQSTSFINNLVLIICSGLIAISAVGGGTTPGGVLAFVILIGRVQWPFVNMSQTWGWVQDAMGASGRVFEILDLPSEEDALPRPPEEKAAETKEGAVDSADPDAPAILLEHVDFGHASSAENKQAPLFRDLNLRVEAGETVAIVGPSGSGKSTLIRLCCGLYPPDDGKVSLHGISLQQRLASGRRLITYVPQIPYLFAGSIRENIVFGTEGKTEEEIRTAAKMAGAHDFIVNLPEGYETVIGEHGASLSGGQKQRIAIARAFLREAPILLLDEATSALDNESESVVQQSLELLMKDRTTLVIAHRLSTIRNANRIVVIDRGRIVEEGTHEELLARQGLYSELYLHQFHGIPSMEAGSG